MTQIRFFVIWLYFISSSVAELTKQISSFFPIESDLESELESTTRLLQSYYKDRNINKLPLILHVVILIIALNTRAQTILQKRRDGEILNLYNDFIILSKL